MTDGSTDRAALLAAITGEPLPAELRRDPAALTAHRAAADDVAALRAGLRDLGAALTAPPESGPRPAPAPRGRFRGGFRRLRPRLLVPAAAALALGVAVWAGAGPGGGSAPEGGPGGDGGASLSPEGFVACAELIAEGTVRGVEPVPGEEREIVTLTVERWYKPSAGPAEVSFPMSRDVAPRLRPGDATIVSVPKGRPEPDNWSTGADRDGFRRMVLDALPGAAGIDCDEGAPPYA